MAVTFASKVVWKFPANDAPAAVKAAATLVAEPVPGAVFPLALSSVK